MRVGVPVPRVAAAAAVVAVTTVKKRGWRQKSIETDLLVIFLLLDLEDLEPEQDVKHEGEEE